jgi:hypothetical protein
MKKENGHGPEYVIDRTEIEHAIYCLQWWLRAIDRSGKPIYAFTPLFNECERQCKKIFDNQED